MVLEKALHMMKAGDIQTSGDHSRTPEALLTTSSLTSCSMNWWRAPGSWSKQHRRRSTSGGGCRASSILHRNCIYIQNQKSSEAHRTCPCGNWTDLFCSLAVSSEYFQRFMRYAARYSLPVWCSERITFSAMCWDATPCDGDGRLGFEISPTPSPSTHLCASGERYFLYRNISNIWPGLYFFLICAHVLTGAGTGFPSCQLDHAVTCL